MFAYQNNSYLNLLWCYTLCCVSNKKTSRKKKRLLQVYVMLCTCISQQSVMYINVKTKRYIRVRYRIGVTYNLMSYNLRFVHAYVTQSRLKFTSRYARYVQACDTIIRATYRIATPLYALHTSLRHHYTRYIQACDTIIRATYKLTVPF